MSMRAINRSARIMEQDRGWPAQMRPQRPGPFLLMPMVRLVLVWLGLMWPELMLPELTWLGIGPAHAQSSPVAQTVEVGGVKAVLIKPSKPVGSIILLAGGDGRIHVEDEGVIKRQGNQLVRTRMDYVRKGFAVLVPDYGYLLADLVVFMQAIKRPVTVAGTSRGTQRAARGLKEGARPDRLVLTSGFLSDASGHGEHVMAILEKPDLLPPTLVIHHRLDRCRVTSPEGVPDFLAWSKGRAKVVWLDGGEEAGPPCEAQSHHGFLGLDQKVVDLVAAFAR